MPAIVTFAVNTTDDTHYAHEILNDLGQVVNVADVNGNTSLRAVVEYGNTHPQNGDWNTNHYNVDLAGIAGQTITLKANINAGDDFQTLILGTNFNFLATVGVVPGAVAPPPEGGANPNPPANAGNVTVERSAANTPPFGLFDLSLGRESHFVGLKFQNGNGPASGAVANAGTAQFEGCVFTNNTSLGSGGAIATFADATTIASNCIFTNNKSSLSGGAIVGRRYCILVSITGCTFTNNEAVVNGGAISLLGFIPDPENPDPGHTDPVGSLFISGSTITGNKVTGGAAGRGGGVYVDTSPSANINQTTISDNTSSWLGGGLFVQDSNMTMTGGSLTNNTATQDGGGFYVNADTRTVTLSGVSVTLNKATNGKGGGGYILKGTLAGSLTGLTGNMSGVAGFAGIVWKTGATATITVPMGQQAVTGDP